MTDILTTWTENRATWNKGAEGVRELIEDIDWITALRSGAIRALIDRGQLQLDLFDERNLFDFTCPDYPDERLVACRNPQLAALRAHKRECSPACDAARMGCSIACSSAARHSIAPNLVSPKV